MIEISGEASGQFGAIDVLADATLGGTLHVALDGLFQPAAGNAFPIVSAETVSGTFETTTLPGLTDGLAWIVDYQPSSVSLAVTFSADFNWDGIVDSQDLAVLQGNFGALFATHTDGDADRDNDVDSQDFLIWQRQFGSASAAGQFAQTPEPATALLLVMAVASRLLGRKSRLG